MSTLILPRWRTRSRDLPEVCMNCGREGELDWRRTQYLWSDWKYLWTFWIPVYNIIVLFTRDLFRLQRLEQPLCLRCHYRYTRFSWLRPICGCTFLILMFLLLRSVYPMLGRGLTIAVGVAMFAGFVLAILPTDLSYIRVWRIDDDTITLVRVHPKFVEAVEADADLWQYPEPDPDFVNDDEGAGET